MVLEHSASFLLPRLISDCSRRSFSAENKNIFFLVVYQLFLSIKSYSIKNSNDRNNDDNKNKQDTYFFSERISHMLYALYMFNIVFYHKTPKADATIIAITDDNDL